MQGNYLTSRDPFGFEMMTLCLSVRLNGVVIPRINVKVVKAIHDQYKAMGEEVFASYLRSLINDYLLENVSVTYTVSDSPW